MPSYRLYLLIKPAPARSAAKRFKDFARAVTAGGGVTHRIQEKATLGLPYPMQAKDRTGIRSLNGTAYTMDYFSSKSCVTEIERNLRMDPDILRFQHSATKRSNHVKLQHLDKSELAEQNAIIDDEGTVDIEKPRKSKMFAGYGLTPNHVRIKENELENDELLSILEQIDSLATRKAKILRRADKFAQSLQKANDNKERIEAMQERFKVWEILKGDA
jgi:ribosomal protein S6